MSPTSKKPQESHTEIESYLNSKPETTFIFLKLCTEFPREDLSSVDMQP